MSELRIILTVLIFCLFGSAIYWKRHWIDKKLQKTWAIPVLLLFATASFLVISIFFEYLFDERPINWEKALHIYGVFSQTSSAYSAAVLGGYIISDATDFNAYNVSISNFADFLPIIEKTKQTDNEHTS